jgi:hypothetical protein
LKFLRSIRSAMRCARACTCGSELMARFDIWYALQFVEVIESIGVNPMLRYAFDLPQSRTSEGSVSNGEHAGVGLPLGHRYRSELGPRYVGDAIKKPA